MTILPVKADEAGRWAGWLYDLAGGPPQYRGAVMLVADLGVRSSPFAAMVWHWWSSRRRMKRTIPPPRRKQRPRDPAQLDLFRDL